MQYKSYNEIPTDHLQKMVVQKRIMLTTDMDEMITLGDIHLAMNSDHIKTSTVKIGVVSSDSFSYYGPDYDGIALYYDGLETDEEFEQRKITWQKAKFKELEHADNALKKAEKEANEKRKKLQKQIDELDRQIIGAQRERQRQMRSRIDNKE